MEQQKFPTDEKVEQARKEGIDLIDARDPEEFENGHIPGAINMPWTEIDQYEVKPGSYLYCNSGRKSEMARQTLADINIPTENIGGLKYYSGELVQKKKS